MKKQELIAEIKEIEGGIKNPDVPEDFKQSMREALKKAVEQLDALDANKPPAAAKPEPVKAPKTATRTDVFNQLSTTFSDLTRQQVEAMSETDHAQLKAKMIVTAKYVGANDNAAAWVTYYLSKKLPEGKPKSAPAPKADKPAPAPKSAPAQAPTPEPLFSYRRKATAEVLKKAMPVNFCTFYAIRSETGGAVDLKNTIQPGEYVVFNADGYLHTVLTENAYQDWCKSAENKQPKAPVEAPKPAADSDEKKAAAPAKPPKRHVCPVEELDVADMSAKLKGFLKENTWTKGLKSKEVEGFYYTLGEKGVILVKMVDWSGLWSKKSTWHKLCPETLSLTKTDPPKPNTYRRFVSESELKEIYTTNGTSTYRRCLGVYQKFAECSRKGNCDADIRQKIKNSYSTCGDLIKRFDIQPDFMRAFHAEVKKRQKDKEIYSQAASRVAKEIRAERGE